MTEVFQNKLHQIVAEIMSCDVNEEEFIVYQSVLSTIYTLIEENRLQEIWMVLQLHFSEYFNEKPPLEALINEN